jgi:NitT/TauT family transport system substrate-binding protein
MMNAKNLGFLLLVVIVIGLLSLPVISSAQETDDDLPTLKIAVLPVLNTLPLYVAETEGFYAEQGVTVELIPFDSARDRQIALQTGEVDGANTDLQGVILLVNGGFDVTAVRMEPIEQAYFSIVAGAESGIETIDDLRGVPIAISTNTIIEYLTTEMLLAAGFTEDEIVYEDVPAIPIRLELLNGGQVAAATLPEPLTTLSVNLQGGILIASDADAMVVPTVLAFNGDVLEENAEAVTAFLAAYEQAVNAINADPEAYRDVMVENIIMPPPLQPTFPVPTFPTAVVPSEEEAQLVMDWMLSVELIEEALAYDSIIDATFLPEVEAAPEADGGEFNLSQSLSTVDMTGGTVTIAFPDGWVSDATDGNIMIASSQATLDKAAASALETVGAGEITIAVMTLPEFTFSSMGLDVDAAPAEVLNVFSTMIMASVAVVPELSEIEAFYTNDKSAALSTGTIAESEAVVSGAMLGAVEVSGGVSIVIVITEADEVADYVDLVKAMMGTIEYELVMP